MRSIMKLQLLIAAICMVSYELSAQINGGVVDVEGTGCSVVEDADTGADSTYTYKTKTKYKTEHLVSDFGPRYLTTKAFYDWHGGVDFSKEKDNKDRGDAIIPLKLGRVYLKIVNIKGQSKKSGYKWIGIDESGDKDYGYEHILWASLKTKFGYTT